ncbi:MAG: metallophosphoesterase [Bacteriovoracaceae bacterium]|nr:metallophosphoesterase [Bacteriovoracaceae bacterium]
MRFLRKTKIQKTLLVISDIHLGAGVYFEGHRNPLEDFNSDHEFVDFIEYFCTGDYAQREVELVINGDFFDFLAVPYVKYFDDEYWSEIAALDKLKIIMNAHPEVLNSLRKFLHAKNKKIIYIIGNHDAEMVFDSLKEELLGYFNDVKDRFIISNNIETYNPHKGIYIQHGHQYERAHHFHLQDCIILSQNGRKYFVPPWGSYYVTRVVNKFKVERSYINEVRPIKNFLIHGLIFDTFFTIRFMLANVFYFLMVRFWHYFMQNPDWKKIRSNLEQELQLFQNFESLTREFFEKTPDAKVLIVGHTHQPNLQTFKDGTMFLNTGTWTKMINLDFNRLQSGRSLTFAQIDISSEIKEKASENYTVDLNHWLGKSDLPYDEYT